MNSQLVFLSCLCAIFGFASCNAFLDVFEERFEQKTEKDLRHHLFKDYDKLVRPVKNPQDRVSVTLGVTPLHVRDLDEKHQVIILETYTLMNWTDDYLKWDPWDFENLSILRISSQEVWRPDFAVYGAPEQSVMSPVPLTNVLVYNTGTVLWVPMFTIRSRCPLLKANKKIVTCNIQIGSWTFDENHLDINLNTEKVDLTNFMDNNINWKLLGVASERVSKHYPCCKEAYPSLNFNVTLKRRSKNEFLDTNAVLAEEDGPIDIQDVILSDFSEIDKLLKR